jgi:putative PIN family toxin of toxin-antitoxin system
MKESVPQIPRIVMDTNVLYAGLRSNSGASFEILEAIWARRVMPVLSQTVLNEYEEIIKFNATSIGLSLCEVDIVLDFLCSVCQRGDSQAVWSPILSDPADEAFVKLASIARADCIVTHNLKHFAPAVALGIKTLAPREFLASIRA